jgi:outer membrane protein assembly factor BamB
MDLFPTTFQGSSGTRLPRCWTGIAALYVLCALALTGCGDMASGTSAGGRPRTASAPVQVSADAGWPCLFGPTHDSACHESGLSLDWPASGPPELWRKEIGGGYSAPVLSGERLILFHRLGDEEVVECLDAASGESRWKFAYPTAYECQYKYSNGSYGTPVIDGDRVHAWGAEGKLHCLNLADGGLIWERSLSDDFQVEEDMFAVASSPLVEGDLLILNVGGSQPDAGIVALNKQTGDTVWTATGDGASYATPCPATIHGNRFVFVLTRAAIVALNPADGRMHWRIPFAAKSPEKINATSPVVWDDMLFVSAYMVGSLCVRVLPDRGYEELWQDRRALDSQFNNVVCRDGYIYGCSSIHRDFRCLDMATGEVQWEWPEMKGRGMSSLLVGDRMLLLGELGHLLSFELDPSEARPVSQTADGLLKSPCFTAPAIHQGRLYLRNESTLLCLDLRGKPAAVAARD